MFVLSLASDVLSIRMNLRGRSTGDEASLIAILNSGLLDFTGNFQTFLPDVVPYITQFFGISAGISLLDLPFETQFQPKKPLETLVMFEECIRRSYRNAKGKPICIFVDEVSLYVHLRMYVNSQEKMGDGGIWFHFRVIFLRPLILTNIFDAVSWVFLLIFPSRIPSHMLFLLPRIVLWLTGMLNIQ
jgi:hypothetical protein